LCTNRNCEKVKIKMSESGCGRYRSKLTVNVGVNDFITIPDPYITKDGWIDNVQCWPAIAYGDIYSYLVESPGENFLV